MGRSQVRLTGAVLASIATTCVVVATTAPAGALAASPRAADAAKSICASAKLPGLAARMSRGIARALKDRTDSAVGLTVTDARDGLTCQLHERWHFDAASVIKVTIISALLLKVGGPAHLTQKQRNLAWLMITESDNNAAQALWEEVGITDMQVFLNKAGMPHTVLNYAWGLTGITAQDQMTLLKLLTTRGKVLSNASRAYVLYLMAHVVSYERWGVPAGAPADVTVHVKNGWLPYPDPDTDDWHINSIGAFTGHNITYEIVILTEPPAGGEQSESYGIDTIQDAAEVINQDLAGSSAATFSVPPTPGAASRDAPGG
jgi:beta-lactamase class A